MFDRLLTAATVPIFLAAAVVLASAPLGCGDNQDGGSSGGCPEGQRLVDGRCTTGGGRDVGRGDLGEGSDFDGPLPDTLGDLLDDGGECQPNSQACANETTVAICDASGTLFLDPCGEGFTCVDGFCSDNTLTCTPGINIGCDDADSIRLCSPDGETFVVEDCPAETPNCLGAGVCSDMICFPADLRCAPGDVNAVETCNAEGDAWTVTETCTAGLTCDAGVCLSPCEENAKLTSFLGCDYWAADLDQIDDAAGQQFSISVSNPNEEPVTVTIENSSSGATQTATVPAETVQAINLARLDVDGTGRTRNAYHITTSLPVTAHQFNPANNVSVFSNDASLLLPTNAAGFEYVVLGWPTGPFGAPGGHAHAYATVIAVDPTGTTMVSITPSVDITAGGGINAILAGTTQQVPLEHGDVLNLQTRSQDGRDLSGTVIRADLPVLAFSGHECAFVPDEEPTLYCDHMEQQLYPVEAWGTRYFGAKLAPRGSEIDVWRVVASVEGTVLSTNPPVSGVNGRTLGPGEVLEFQTNQNFELTATNPILLGQYMTGSNYPGIPQTCPIPTGSFPCGASCPLGYSCSEVDGQCLIDCSNNTQCSSLVLDGSASCQGGVCVGTGIGDPAFMLTVPVNQYRDNYIFLTPADYQQDWFTVVAAIGTELTLDGNPLLASVLTPVGDSGFGIYHHDVSSTGASDPATAHTINGSNDFALQVYGYDCDVSYAYPGGLNLESEE